MHTLTSDEVSRQPGQLLDEAARGEPSLVIKNGEPIFMAVPLGDGLNAASVRMELAARLFDHEQISIGVAARIAGLSISEMIDELGRRGIPVVRYTSEELARELDYVRTLADRG